MSYCRISYEKKLKIKRHAAKHPFIETARKFGVALSTAWQIYNTPCKPDLHKNQLVIRRKSKEIIQLLK